MSASKITRERLGNKGFHLHLLSERGYPVPPFAVLDGPAIRAGVDRASIAALLDRLRGEAATRMAVEPEAVAFAVRSSPPVSMPGMMDTLLGLGVGETAVPALTARLGSAELARTLLRIGERDLRTHLGERVPEEPVDQVHAAVAAVRDSWNNERARDYRRDQGISDGLAPAVVVQAMVFGLGERSGSGVVFSHDPLTGARGMHGEYLSASTGAALVAGQVTPEGLARLARESPAAHAELDRFVGELFAWQRVLIEVEFVVERGRLWLVQLRAATASEAVRTVVTIDAWRSGLLDRATALVRLSPRALCAEDRQEAAAGHGRLLATGIGAAGGVATGRVVRTVEEALAHAGEPVVLLRPTTEPEDFLGMTQSAGIITLAGGFGSHAAVVARELGRPAVVGARFTDPDWPDAPHAAATVTVCGTTGRVWEGRVPAVSRPAVDWPADLLGDAPPDGERPARLRELLAANEKGRR
ncbi:PEP-utilizing enzyme [Nocardia sp. CDC159]|uniref:PEP-utilizing enzyme n=1 Tax=Nocardia pulmonis TaxID=2951408 RepID=A0A9X2E2N1_9NOCA|nr:MULTISPECIES: PEP/pyruvate-binding domain-containing protein [Nocardia]MCM6773142.1 PEP-utilizing enzyme [Nocardia pulmonis]MCM6785555.1 PEP-utilizing enzyme [Nocardia sp. CDC159]